MKKDHPLVAGQLLTPLTRYHNWGGPFAIDNGCFKRFLRDRFEGVLRREQERDYDVLPNCLFVTCPDVVGNARRTRELWIRRHSFVSKFDSRWADRLALVAQDGIEDSDIPWDEFTWIFIGGRDPWKDSQASQDIVRTAKTLNKFVHVGRVNDPDRWERFAELGADTCDGSGVSKHARGDDQFLRVVERAAAFYKVPRIDLNEFRIQDILEKLIR